MQSQNLFLKSARKNKSLDFCSEQVKSYVPLAKKKKEVYTSFLIEDAEMEIMLCPTKSPVTILQNICYKTVGKPTYKYMTIVNPGQMPIFRATVSVGEAFVLGLGRNKREAKNAAAKNFLEKLLGHPLIDDGGKLTLCPSTDNRSACLCDEEFDNPIGALQEFCMKKGWKLPKYEVIKTDGPLHSRQFTITCTVRYHREEGTGTSKKGAKQAAAFKIWKKLRESNLDNSELNCATKVSLASNEYTEKYSREQFSTVITAQNFSTFHYNYELTSQDLYENGIIFDDVEYLRNLASEKKFEVTYIRVKEKSIRGEHQCLVRLSTLPVIVCYGSGITFEDAQSAAARHAVEYLKIKGRK